MEHKEIVRELIAIGISLHIREINYNEAVDLINKNLLEYSKLNNLSLSHCCTEFCVKYDKDTQIRLLIELAERLGKEKE